MFISLFSELETLVPGWETAVPKKDRTFHFITRLDLRTLGSSRPVTFERLMTYIFCDLEFNPPKQLRGQIFCIRIFQILYWTEPHGPRSGYYQKIEIPNNIPLHELPPLAKLDGTYRVLFFSTHLEIGDADDFLIRYPKSPRARMRHAEKKWKRKHVHFQQ